MVERQSLVVVREVALKPGPIDPHQLRVVIPCGRHRSVQFLDAFAPRSDILKLDALLEVLGLRSRQGDRWQQRKKECQDDSRPFGAAGDGSPLPVGATHARFPPNRPPSYPSPAIIAPRCFWPASVPGDSPKTLGASS